MKYFLLIVAVCLTSPATAYLKESSGVIVRSLPRRVLYVYPRNEQSANSLFSLRPRGSPKASGRKSDALHPQASKGSDIDPQKHATDPRSDQSPFLRSGGPNSASRPPLPPSFRSNMAVAREAKVAALRDGRRKNEQKTRTMMDQLEVENPKPDAKAQPKKPPRSPTVIDVTSMFNTLRDIQKHWSPGDQSSAAFPGQASHAPDSSSIRQLPTDAEALGIQASRSKGSLDRTSGGKPIAPYESKEKSSEI